MKNYAVGFAQVATPGNSSPRQCAAVGMILFIEEQRVRVYKRRRC